MTPWSKGRWAVRAAAPAGQDRGSATVELAVSLPGLVLLLFVALSAVTAVRIQIECVDAARDGALAAARGEDGSSAATHSAPPGASVVVSVDGATARATVTVRITPLGGRLPGYTVTATAVAETEPGSP